MKEEPTLAALADELRALETDTFELVDYVDAEEMLINLSTTSTSSSCCSGCSM